MQGMTAEMMHSMFHLPVPVLEKLLRPVIMFLILVLFVRLFGKRELAQLNPLDLIVLLCLSNTVQNAIIGDDNSVSGGVIGAFGLLGINWALSKVLFRYGWLNSALEGKPTILVHDGQVDKKALEKETMTREELISVLNKNGFNDPYDVELARLEPNGTFFVKGKSPSDAELKSRDLLEAVENLTKEVSRLRRRLDERESNATPGL